MTLENASINVALCIRADAESSPGGDWLQLQKTANTLQALGVNTQICVGRVPEQPVDLVHAFNLTRLSNTHMVAQWCQQNDVPLVISPIWHSLADMGLFYAEHFRHWPGQCFPMPAYLALKELLYERGHWNRYVWTAALRWRMTQRKTVQQAAVLLPNSPEEGRTLEQALAVNAKVTHVIPNAVDLGHCYSDQSPKEKLIVCPGRLEPRKNQERVVEAFLASKALQEYDLLLLGALNQRHAAYQGRFLTLVNTHDRLRWLDHVSFEEAQRIYARSALAACGRLSDRSERVGAQCPGAQARRYGRSRAAAGSAGNPGAVDVPGVAAAAVVGIVRGASPGEFMQIRLSDEKRAGLAKPAPDIGIGGGNILG